MLGDVAVPSLAGSSALVAEAAKVVTLVVADVAVAGHVDAVGATAVEIAIEVAFPFSTGAGPEMVVHEVMPKLARVVAEAVGETIGDRVQKDRGRADGAGADKNDFREKLSFFVRLRVDNGDATGALRLGIVDNFANNGVGTQGKVPGFRCGGKGGGLGAEVGSIRATVGAAVAIHAGARVPTPSWASAALLRLATRPIVMLRPGKFFSMRLRTSFSTKDMSIGGRNSLSGSWGSSRASPEMPANFST